MWLTNHPRVALGAMGAIVAGAIAGIASLARDD
jgi:hypothetical protein